MVVGSKNPRSSATFQTDPLPRLDLRTKMEHRSRYVQFGRDVMIRAVVEEAAALASLALFLGMIAIWAQVIATF
jgi:hypothetical protein